MCGIFTFLFPRGYMKTIDDDILGDFVKAIPSRFSIRLLFECKSFWDFLRTYSSTRPANTALTLSNYMFNWMLSWAGVDKSSY
jgi:hypothetical protein